MFAVNEERRSEEVTRTKYFAHHGLTSKAQDSLGISGGRAISVTWTPEYNDVREYSGFHTPQRLNHAAPYCPQHSASSHDIACGPQELLPSR